MRCYHLLVILFARWSFRGLWFHFYAFAFQFQELRFEFSGLLHFQLIFHSIDFICFRDSNRDMKLQWNVRWFLMWGGLREACQYAHYLEFTYRFSKTWRQYMRLFIWIVHLCHLIKVFDAVHFVFSQTATNFWCFLLDIHGLILQLLESITTE